MSKPTYEELEERIKELEEVEVDRNKTEEALRESEEKFRTLFRFSKAGIAITTLDGKFLDANDSYLEMLGYTFEELEKVSYSDLTPEKWHKMETGILSEAINTGHTRNFEKEYIGKDGTIIPVFVNACVMRDLEGNANRLGAIVTDITDRKRAEEKIKESDERFELAMKATEDGIWDWDIITNEVYRSPGYLELIGYESHELDETPNRWWELMHQDDRERVRAALYKHIEKKSIYDEEFRILTKGGECRWFRSCGKAIWDDKGNPIRMVGAIQNITARKKAEKALEESMSLLADSQKSGNVGSWSWDLITGEAVWSEQLYHIYGRDIKLGIPSMESYLEAYHPDDRESLQNVIETSIKKDTPYIIDYRIFRENTGEERWLHSEGKLEKDNNGNPIRLIGISVDITDRKRAEEQLFENEKLLKTVTENVKDAIFSKDIEGRYTFVNPIAAKMLGLTEKEIIGKRAEDILSEEDAAIIKEVDSLNFKGEPVSEVRQLQVAGVENFLHTIQTPVFDNNGEIIGISGSVRDITKHKKAEEALRISSEKYEDIFRVVPTLMAVSCLEDGKYLEVNDVFAEATGYSKAEVIGKTPNELGLTAGAGYRDKMKSELKKHGRFQNVEVAIRRKDGEIRDGLLFGEVFEADGQKRLLSLWTDITERRQLEEQLQIRQRMDSLGTLAGGIAHDFNNILVGIMGNIDLLLLEADMLSDLQKESLNDAMISCERAANLIRQFQVLSRGAIRGKSTVDIYDISVEVFSLLKETTDRLITKQIRFNKDEYFVTADSGELHQVLLNLATNSAQAIEERGAEKGAFIRIKAEDYESGGADKTGLAEGNYIHISFEDSGIGMSDEVMKKAFDPMFTTKEIGVKKGQGLGLAMVYNIITRINNGHVYIDSKEGKGTTFHIYLPKTQSGPGAEHKTPA
ncbi:MAG: PAS domain S-box protein, partial [bacterium]|nr:PAS domain S-box protein [bacterium]